MPKVFLTESQKYNFIIKNNLILIQGNKSSNEMGKIIGVSKGTYLNRLKSPEQLTVSEVIKLCQYFKINIGSFLTEKLTYK